MCLHLAFYTGLISLALIYHLIAHLSNFKTGPYVKVFPSSADVKFLTFTDLFCSHFLCSSLLQEPMFLVPGYYHSQNHFTFNVSNSKTHSLTSSFCLDNTFPLVSPFKSLRSLTAFYYASHPTLFPFFFF